MSKRLGVDLSSVLMDCGKMMYDDSKQGTNSGASGCGCSASIFTGYFYNELLKKNIRKILLVPTGALMNATSTQQGNTIPGIAHAVCIEMK